MTGPLVSFVVPCYKLAHLLPECVNSILSQSYRNLEVLIMDDCSPDNTAAVARSFQDSRVRHIRNYPNLGHLRNYNKGIKLSQGKYVWLISADDYLRRPYVLQKYVDLMEQNPRVGYTFCSGVGVQNGAETGVVDYSRHGEHDRIIAGRDMLRSLLKTNTVLAAAVLARRECYEKVSYFPLNLGETGDWYLWSVFALFYDAGYFAEPMVCYRQHELSMTTKLVQQDIDEKRFDEVRTVFWMTKHKADSAGLQDASKDCLDELVNHYTYSLIGTLFGTGRPLLGVDAFESSVARNAANKSDKAWVRSHVYVQVAEQYYLKDDLPSAKKFYTKALQSNPWAPEVAFKRLFLSLGKPGKLLRRGLGFMRRKIIATG